MLMYYLLRKLESLNVKEIYKYYLAAIFWLNNIERVEGEIYKQNLLSDRRLRKIKKILQKGQ